jgi:hypothetical protein
MSCLVFIVFVVFPDSPYCATLHCTDLRDNRIAILVFLVIVESPCEFLYCSVLHCAVLHCPRSQQIVCIVICIVLYVCIVINCFT